MSGLSYVQNKRIIYLSTYQSIDLHTVNDILSGKRVVVREESTAIWNLVPRSWPVDLIGGRRLSCSTWSWSRYQRREYHIPRPRMSFQYTGPRSTFQYPGATHVISIYQGHAYHCNMLAPRLSFQYTWATLVISLYRDCYSRVVHGSLFLDPTRPDPTRPDPAKRWPDPSHPTRDCRQEMWPDPARPDPRPLYVLCISICFMSLTFKLPTGTIYNCYII